MMQSSQLRQQPRHTALIPYSIALLWQYLQFLKILKQRKASVDPEKLCSARPSVPLIALQQEFLWESKLWEMKDLEEVFGKHPAVASSWCGKAGPVL